VTADEIRTLVRENTKLRTQRMIVGICLMITIIDGFDILSISFVAPIIARSWGISPVELGIVFSSGLAGMMVGALALSPLGDLLGRRTAIVINLVMIGCGMLLTATAHDVTSLALYRFLAGLGIGAMISSTGTLIMEFIPLAKRTRALGLMLVGNPAGNLISGLVSLAVVHAWGWQAVFVVGGVLTLAMIPAAYFGMPESIDYGLVRRPKGALGKINASLHRAGLPPLEALPPPVPAAERVRAWEVLRGRLLKVTIMAGAVQFIFMFAYYIFVNWSPKLMTEMGASDQAGVTIAMMINLGGIFGPLLVGFATPKVGLVRTTAIGYCAIATCLVAFGAAPGIYVLLGGIALIAGFSIFATQVPLYALVAGSYPSEVRATAVGLTFALGRIGSVIGPTIAGFLLAAETGRFGLFLVAALPMFLAALLVTRMRVKDDL